MSQLEEMFVFQLKAVGMPDPVREYKFHPDRRWRLDFYWETDGQSRLMAGVGCRVGITGTQSPCGKNMKS